LNLRPRDWTAGQRRVIVSTAGAAVALVIWAVTSAIWPKSAPLGLILQGVVFGTVDGLLAIGLVLIYRTNKIINFAFGAMGGVAGVLSVMLFLQAGVPYFLAMAIGLVTGFEIGRASCRERV